MSQTGLKNEDEERDRGERETRRINHREGTRGHSGAYETNDGFGDNWTLNSR